MADKKWTTLSQKWMFYLPPGRPSRTDLEVMAKVIRDRFPLSQGINALVLGATPEYRDLLHKMGANVSVVDRNPEMIQAMGQLRIFDSKEQIYVESCIIYYNMTAFPIITHKNNTTLTTLEENKHLIVISIVSRQPQRKFKPLSNPYTIEVESFR